MPGARRPAATPVRRGRDPASGLRRGRRERSDVALDLTLACGDYDRTRALADGRVRVEGVDLHYVPLEPEEVFFRMARHQEFDAAELSLSTYVVSLFRDGPFVAIPIFPSRMFRHSGVYLNTGAGITAPGDLSGRLVGLPEYQLTALVWIRGILAEHHGLAVTAPRYRTGGLHDPGRAEKVALNLPPEIDIAPVAAGRTLSEMLLAGEIDALYSPRAPRPFQGGDPRVGRLFPDARRAEADYFRATGVFPIMHTVVLRREVYERNRWLARSLTKAFVAAKRVAEQEIRRTAALSIMLPWALEEIADTERLLGADWWTYGLEANRTALDTFLRYAHEQYLAPRLLTAGELFAPEALDEVLI